MAAKQLPEYQEWEQLVTEKWDHWQHYLDMYSYALQKPARSFLTGSFYPGLYQQRLLSRDFAAAMQAVGEVKPEEVEEYARLTDNPKIKSVYAYHTELLHGYWFWNPLAAAVSATLTGVAVIVAKPKVWYFVPGALAYLAMMGIQNRIHATNIGAALDLAQWTAEKRKASIWLKEKTTAPANLPPLTQMQQQMVHLVTSFKG